MLNSLLLSILVTPGTAQFFPSGPQTPEGVACDLARSFIGCDPKLFRATIVAPVAGKADDEYRKFVKRVVQDMATEAAKKTPSPGGPAAIVACFNARNLSRNGPSSYGFAVMDYLNVKFVDVKVKLNSGAIVLNRTLVVQSSDKNWHVHPRPDLVPMLSTGLNRESASKIEWKPAKKGG